MKSVSKFPVKNFKVIFPAWMNLTNPDLKTQDGCSMHQRCSTVFLCTKYSIIHCHKQVLLMMAIADWCTWMWSSRIQHCSHPWFLTSKVNGTQHRYAKVLATSTPYCNNVSVSALQLTDNLSSRYLTQWQLGSACCFPLSCQKWTILFNKI